MDPSPKVTEGDVRNANFRKVMKLCKQFGVEADDYDSLDAIKEELIKRINDDNLTSAEKRQSQVPSVFRPDMMQILMDRITEKFESEKSTLLDIYHQVDTLLQRKDFDAFMQMEIERRYGELGSLKDRMDDLQFGDRPIVVTGETAAGKSSFMNLLIDTDVLPTSVLKCTMTICRLRNSQEKKLIVTTYANEEIVFSNMTDENLKEKIQHYTKYREGIDQERVKYVDIYWPIPLLRENTIIVDTPGLGDDSKLTERLFDYLPRALAFIYVLNTPNAGGVQGDRLGRIFKEQQRRKKKGEHHAFDGQSALFICNKWDEVPKHEEEDVWKQVVTSLQNYWPGLSESQVLKFSVRDVQKGYHRDHFMDLYNAINRLIPASLRKKIMEHLWWNKEFLNSVLHIIATKININRMNKEERERYIKTMRKRLRDFKNRIQEKNQELKTYVNDIRDLLAGTLHRHLHSESTKRKLFDWIEEECPEIEEGNPETKLKIIVLNRIGKEITYWFNCQDNRVREFLETISKEFFKTCSDLQNDFRTAIEDMEGVETALSRCMNLQIDKIRLRKVSIFESFSHFIFELRRIIMERFLTTKVTDTIDRAMYDRNKLKYMNNCTEKVMKTLTEEGLRDNLHTLCFDEINASISKALVNTMLKHVELEEIFISHLITVSKEHEESLLAKYHPLQSSCEAILGEILYLELFSVSENYVPFSDIEIIKVLKAGQFSTIFRSVVSIVGGKQEVSMIQSNSVLTQDEKFEELGKIESMRMLKHKNIAEITGQSLYQDQDGFEHVCVVMEMCDGTLEEKIQESHPCYKSKPNTVGFEQSLELYADVGMQICQGIMYVHQMGYLHRSLTIDNILMKGEIVKIINVGREQRLQLETEIATKELAYYAPEILNGNSYAYRPAVDIYSFGFILWELWYGMRIHEDTSYPMQTTTENFKTFVKGGGRPDFKMMKPLPDLKNLIESCWQNDPSARPKASDVFESMKHFHVTHCGKSLSIKDVCTFLREECKNMQPTVYPVKSLAEPGTDDLILLYSEKIDKESEQMSRGYRVIFRNPKDVSEEALKVIQSDIDHTKLSQTEMILAKSVIALHGSRLFENHRNLNIISASPVRSKSSGSIIVKEFCIVLYCSSKGLKPDEEEEFPRILSIDSKDIPVDVREGFFEFSPSYRTSSSTDFHQQIKMGCGFGIDNSPLEGTVGPLVKMNGDKYFLTCAHTTCGVDPNGYTYDKNANVASQQRIEYIVMQPSNGSFSQSEAPREKHCGEVMRAVFQPHSQSQSTTNTSIDAAIVRISNPLRCPLRGEFAVNTDSNLMDANFRDLPRYEDGSVILDPNQIDTDARIVKFGMKTHATRGVINSLGTMVRSLTTNLSSSDQTTAMSPMINQYEIGSVTTCNVFFQPGDSGSGVFQVTKENNVEKLHLIGLAIGYSSYHSAVVTPISPVLRALGLHPDNLRMT